MKEHYRTKRLLLDPLQADDAAFILELVNTEEWLKFIGERNVKTTEDASLYVQKIMYNPDVAYRVVKTEEQIRIGVITFIKRDYLEHPDIGFAFLPAYIGQGYAREAAEAVLADVMKDGHAQVLATTVKENENSIRLLEKLGFELNTEIKNENTLLLVYGLTNDGFYIDRLVKSFYNVFANEGRQPDLDSIHALCIPEALIIKKSGPAEEIYSLSTFIEPRRKILTDGTLTGFAENEVRAETKIAGNIAQRFSEYQKSGRLQGTFFHEYGNKLFQFVKTGNGWKISALIWEDHQK